METRKKQNNLPLTHLYLDSGALSALLTPNKRANKLQAGSLTHFLSPELENQSFLKSSRPTSVVVYRRRKVDEILGQIFPLEKPLLQLRLQSSKITLPTTRFPDTGHWPLAVQCAFILDDNEASMIEQTKLKKSIPVKIKTLLQYDVSLSDAKLWASFVSRKYTILFTTSLRLGKAPVETLSIPFPFYCEMGAILKICTEWKNEEYQQKRLQDCLFAMAMVHYLTEASMRNDSQCTRIVTNKKQSLPDLQDKRQLAKIHPIRGTSRLTPRCLKNQHEVSTLELEREMLLTRQAQNRITSSVNQSRVWLRDHCPIHLLALAPSTRKQFAAEKLQTALLKYTGRVRYAGLIQWKMFTLSQRHVNITKCYLKHKGCTLLLSRARRQLNVNFRHRWTTWRTLLDTQKELELIAATLTLQSFVRQILATLFVQRVREKNAVGVLEKAWYYFTLRKLSVRRRRYVLCTASCRTIQRQLRVHHFRARFHTILRQNTAIRCIQRGTRCSTSRHKVSELRNTRRIQTANGLRIQCWFRCQTARHRLLLLRRIRRKKAIEIIIKAWKSSRLRHAVLARVLKTRKRRGAAATKLQQRYRIRMARRAMSTLRDTLQSQRRQLNLKIMWEKSSAITLQIWWRRILAYRDTCHLKESKK